MFVGVDACYFNWSSASLSMLPWPRPIVWPAIPTDADDLIAEKAKVNSSFHLIKINFLDPIIHFY